MLGTCAAIFISLVGPHNETVMVDACKISHIENYNDPSRFKTIKCRVYAGGRPVDTADKCEDVTFRIKLEMTKAKEVTQS